MFSKHKSETPTKKFKRLCNFNDKWLNDQSLKDWLKKLDEFTVSCNYCKSNFTIKYEGIAAINRHKSSESHKKNTSHVKSSQCVSDFLRNKDSDEYEKVIIAEVCMAYHGIIHHHSYRSTECNVKLAQLIFPDSKISKKLHCGRTKLEAIALNVLSPHSIEIHLNKLENKSFSISTDASNKGNIKLFPVAIQYFTIEEGIQNFVLDFYEDSNETSEAIHNNLTKILQKNNLDLKRVIAYGADNASVNYGKYNSVFQKFKQNSDHIIKANCNCHIIHNTAKYALLKFPLDIENLVIKIYSHFSVSSKRLAALKSCYDYTENDYQTLLKHIPVRWLSLFNAIDRLINNLDEVKSYFIGIGTDECPDIISNFVWDEKNKSQVSMSDIYLYFVHQFMSVFNETLLDLQKKETNATNLYNIMESLKGRLENRIKYNFFGDKVNKCLEIIGEYKSNDFKSSALIVYQRAIDYLEKTFDYNNTIFKLFSTLNLDSELVHEKVISIAEALNLEINVDKLFDECCDFNNKLISLPLNAKMLNTLNKWCELMKTESNNKPNLLKIIETVMAIPIGNDFVERVFSVMKNIWTDERNRLNICMVKAEICSKVNFSMTCNEFKVFASKNPKLLKDAKSNDKYSKT
jgi:hypothetical protein